MIGRNGLIGLGLAALLVAGAAAQTVREKPLDDMPAIDRGAAPPARTATDPPPPPPVPKAPRVTNRAAPPPVYNDEDAAPPARETPPATRNSGRTYDPPPPARRVDRTRAAAPPTRSTFAANCTQQCHLACEASFEACNGDDSPAKPECVRKLESCRIERCSCRMD